MTQFSLIVGLGNPGPRYSGNRHNIGFQVIDAFAEKNHLQFSRTEHYAQTAHGEITGYRLILAKPQTWMNDSGKAVGPLSRYYRIPSERMLIIYDDLDIPLGTIRYRSAGTSGGHRGVESIIQHIGNTAIPRLRLGIGRPPGQMDPAAYVLQNYADEELTDVWEIQRTACSLLQDWLAGTQAFQQNGMTWRVNTTGESK
ncbi:MAG: aminoacyl-tRNA hydrolase [Anaerolineae bacterium]|nr:aminoacyl-tRNA hydrolase [Anaerolineae bacterium]